ncbi:polyprenyl diphosphate synthase [Lacrimispora algidixylanolytica]|uniref:Isoprenyl transferase n=1 Tax=Lacrimispora algidixylanolytica TaxID=94868 RepID=A0A419T2T0_9FIRM|nr:polyprenyl diphosphate synthase [Lacrimispora algidixylanolytica]RKD31746.1 di-trans,poly-cis-decaprenylcistransferase [Lacrimispora algidixylanolytica]
MENNQVVTGVPEHIGIIMDGNRRWARQNCLPVNQGHSEGVKVLKKIIRKCSTIGIKYLTVFTLSTDNRNRDKKEMQNLMTLINLNLMAIAEFKKENIQVKIVGDRENLSDSLLHTIDKVEKETADCTGLILSFAFNYGGQDEITSAFNSILSDNSIDEVSVELFEKHLFSGYLPEPELVIRTGGEKRTSGFLLWKAAYSELFFCNKFWPDFSENDLIEMIDEYNHRERNRGQ